MYPLFHHNFIPLLKHGAEFSSYQHLNMFETVMIVFRSVLASPYEDVSVRRVIGWLEGWMVGLSVINLLFFYRPKMKEDATFELIAQ